MTLKKIENDLLNARKNKDKFRAETLTVLLSEIRMVGKNRGDRETTEEETIAVITKFKKGVLETIEILKKTNSDTNKFEEEIGIYNEYLPKQLDEEELRDIILEWKTSNTIDNPNIGSYMQLLNKEYPNQFNGKVASKAIKEVL